MAKTILVLINKNIPMQEIIIFTDNVWANRKVN